VIYGWQPSSAAMSNGFSSPDDNGCYLALGKVQDAKKAVLPVTWLFDPARGTWTELKPTQSPPARSHGNVVYHAGLKLWVLYGGFGYEEKDAMSDTWIFAPHLGTWLEIARDGNPPPCANGALWYDEDGEQIIFLGAARTEQQTWVLTVTAAEEARQDH
jgi:hypothetical protein